MSDPRQLIRTARGLLGTAQPEADWEIVPTKHAEALPEEAAPLVDILLSSRVEGLAAAYERLNADAVRARDLFKSTVRKADVAVFLTAVFGALLLGTAGTLPLLTAPRWDEFGTWAVRGFGALGAISGAAAGMLLTRVRSGELAAGWARTRAKAEAKRLAYFNEVVGAASPQPLDQLLALEYVRRFLLDNQIAYFLERGQQHGSGAADAMNAATRAAFLGSVFTMGAGAVIASQPELAGVASLGLIAAAYSTLATSKSEIDQDRKNADRYLAAYELLSERRWDLDDFRARAAGGDSSAVGEFFTPVFAALEADHRGFLQDSELREAAIGAIEERLSAETGRTDQAGGGRAEDEGVEPAEDEIVGPVED